MPSAARRTDLAVRFLLEAFGRGPTPYDPELRQAPTADFLVLPGSLGDAVLTRPWILFAGRALW